MVLHGFLQSLLSLPQHLHSTLSACNAVALIRQKLAEVQRCTRHLRRNRNLGLVEIAGDHRRPAVLPTPARNLSASVTMAIVLRRTIRHFEAGPCATYVMLGDEIQMAWFAGNPFLGFRPAFRKPLFADHAQLVRSAQTEPEAR
jgi:hypothetical protein